MSKFCLISLLLVTLFSCAALANADQSSNQSFNSDYYLAWSNAKSSVVEQETPPLDMNKSMIQVASGVGFGLLGGAAGGFIGAQIGKINNTTGWESLIGFLLGGIGGYTVGSPVGVYFVGNTDEVTGSFFASFVGAVLGTVAVATLAEPLHLNENRTIMFGSLLLAPPIGATIGFNFTRRYKNTSSSLINLEDRKVSFNVPALQTAFNQKSKAIISYTNLLEVKF